MTLKLIQEGRYDRLMATLPSPARAMTLEELDADRESAIEDLKAGGAILVLSNDRERYFGVLTRDPAVVGDAELAQQIQAGHLPPLEELLAESVDDTQPNPSKP